MMGDLIWGRDAQHISLKMEKKYSRSLITTKIKNHIQKYQKILGRIACSLQLISNIYHDFLCEFMVVSNHFFQTITVIEDFLLLVHGIIRKMPTVQFIAQIHQRLKGTVF